MEQVRAFVEGSEPVDYKPMERASAYAFVRRTLARFDYAASWTCSRRWRSSSRCPTPQLPAPARQLRRPRPRRRRAVRPAGRAIPQPRPRRAVPKYPRNRPGGGVKRRLLGGLRPRNTWTPARKRAATGLRQRRRLSTSGVRAAHPTAEDRSLDDGRLDSWARKRPALRRRSPTAMLTERHEDASPHRSRFMLTISLDITPS